MYIIRKSKNGVISATPSGRSISYLFIFFPLVFGAIFGAIIFFEKNVEIGIGPIILASLILGICFYAGIRMYINDSKIKKLKSYKKTGGGIVKKVRITSIEHYYDPGDEDSSGFDGYYLESQEGDMIYCSDAFEGGIFYGTSLDELKKIYKHYGFDYDEKNKNNVLRAIENEIIKNKSEAQVDGFFKGYSKRMDINVDKKWLDIVKKGYIVPCIEINGHKVSVGDNIDVYVDPEDESNYRMDTDFLFDK